jgi:ABC-type transport system involved in cytochrome c biogenesis permease subunit
VAALLTAVGFTGSLFLPPEGYAISPPVAILHSPWREVHILTIMLSYAILLVAFGLHAGCVAATLAAPRGPGSRALLAERLHRDAVLTVGWGFFFLTVGIATGAAWANSSWGRYWGWDPKEVWATVAWLVYALFLHLRVFFNPRREVLAAVNAVGFAAILFTYFGVSYLLAGLHAYR